MARLYARRRTTDSIELVIVDLDEKWEDAVNGARMALIREKNWEVGGILHFPESRLSYEKTCSPAMIISGLDKGTEYTFSCIVYKTDTTEVIATLEELTVATLDKDPAFKLPINTTDNSITATVININDGWDYVTNALRYARWYISREDRIYDEGYTEKQIFNGETSAYCEFSGLSSGTEYWFKCELVNKLPIEIDGYTKYTMLTVEHVLEMSLYIGSPISSIEVSQGVEQSLNFTWDAIAGAEKYKAILICEDDETVVATKTVSENKVSFSGLEGGTAYTIEVSYDIGSVQSERAVLGGCITRPKFPTIKQITQTDTNKIEVTWTIDGNVDFLQFMVFDNLNSYSGEKTENTDKKSGKTDISFIFSEAGQYKLQYCTGYEGYSSLAENSSYYKTINFDIVNMNKKPEPWEWNNPAVDGCLELDENFEVHPVTYVEWNDLRAKINAMRAYLGKEVFDFGDNVGSRDEFSSEMYNDVRIAIQGMGYEAGSLIPEVSNSTCIDAWHFEILRDELNAAINNL